MDISQFELHAALEDTHWWFKARREIIFDILNKYVAAGENRLIAEIGCGTGGNLKFLQKYYRVTGVDISPEAVQFASSRVGCRILQGDFREELAGRWHELDAVLLADVLEHVPDDSLFLHDLVSLLRPGSVVLLTVPAHKFLWSGHDVVLGHVRRYGAEEFRKLGWQLPVEELYFTAFNSILFPFIALFRLIGKDRRSGNESDLSQPPRFINWLLYRLFVFERILLKFRPFKWGVSYLMVLRKK